MTETELCNVALGMLGHDRVIAGDFRSATSAEAMRCRLFFDAARKAVLSCGAPWVFATDEVELARDEACGTTEQWSDLPANALHVIRIDDAESGRPLDYGHGPARGTVALENCTCGCRPRVHYVRDETDLSLWPPLALDALAAELAARLAGPMTGNADKAKSARLDARNYLAEAETWNANQTGNRRPANDRYTAARR